MAKANWQLRRRQLRRWFMFAMVFLVAAWGLLEWSRHQAEHRIIPGFVIQLLPPSGPMAAQFIAAGITNIITPIPYEQVTNPPISVADVAAIKRCLARDKFFPLWPQQIEIDGSEVYAAYPEMWRGIDVSQEFVGIVRKGDRWHIAGKRASRGTACLSRPLTRWEKFLGYLPFTD